MLCYTIAKIVRCTDAVIGEGCEIEVLEYSGAAEVHPKAKIGKVVKI
ncbi:MAG: hypothetical protein IJW55_09900 [Clostridia bacterium]|nr:hypothetical protein [Clostridia bacterium]MBQ7348259.1 hypothetical protein [Clostridia bacterium]